MTVAQDIMTRDCECVSERANLAEAARKMRDLDGRGLAPPRAPAGAGDAQDRRK